MQMHDKGVITSSHQTDHNRKDGSPYSEMNSGTPAVTGSNVRKGHAGHGGRQGQGKGHGPQRMGRNYSSLVPQKRQSKSMGEYIGKDGDSHYVDPPQEFFFKSTKEAKYVNPFFLNLSNCLFL